MRKTHTYASRTTETLALLGSEIARSRRARRLTQAELAERAGVSPHTVASVEQGSPTVGIGTVFELAYLAGLDLIAHPDDLPQLRARAAERLALLPSRVRQRVAIDDNF